MGVRPAAPEIRSDSCSHDTPSARSQRYPKKKHRSLDLCFFSFHNKTRWSGLRLGTGATFSQNRQSIGCYDGADDE